MCLSSHRNIVGSLNLGHELGLRTIHCIVHVLVKELGRGFVNVMGWGSGITGGIFLEVELFHLFQLTSIDMVQLHLADLRKIHLIPFALALLWFHVLLRREVEIELSESGFALVACRSDTQSCAHELRRLGLSFCGNPRLSYSCRLRRVNFHYCMLRSQKILYREGCCFF